MDAVRNVIVIGASGHGSVVIDCIEKSGNYTIVGLVDSYKKKGSLFFDYTVLGGVEHLKGIIERHNIQGGIVAIGDNWIRKKVVDEIIALIPDFKFITVIHPKSSIDSNVKIGDGTVIMPGARVMSGNTIGDFCILNTHSLVNQNCYMEDFSSIAPKVTLGSQTRLGAFSAVGLGAQTIGQLKIGSHSVVGAGSLVLHDIKDKTTVYGFPVQSKKVRSIGEPYLSRK